MEETSRTSRYYGLIGRNISYSFSKAYFTEKFLGLGLRGHSYENFDLASISEFRTLLKQRTLHGLNVTIPYKQEIIPYLHELSPEAETIGAVNTIKFSENRLIGHNTDAYGFKRSLAPLLKDHHQKALILGTGGASKAVVFVLDQLGIGSTLVSRSPGKGQLSYANLGTEHLEANLLLINCSPVGTYPNLLDKPTIPYEFLTSNHLLYDLIYNPEETAFLTEGRKRGAVIQNGLAMLQFQAERAWEIWNS